MIHFPLRDQLSHWMMFLVLGLVLLTATTASAQTTSVTAAFQTIRTTSIWPASGTTFDAVESTFGPRIKASSGAYDWHRGIDIDALEGTPVVAVQPATLFDITTYVDGGLTVILKHTFPTPIAYKGQTLNNYYTFHMHLSAVEAGLLAAFNLGQRPVVAAGATIGFLGHSGTAIGDHLHFELRVGGPYSLEWQLAHPTSQYAVFGFDPHMHPLLLLNPWAPSATMSLTLTTKPTSKIDGKVLFSVIDDQPLLNRVEFKIVLKSNNSVVKSHVLDFNERLGFNATSTAALDTQDKTKPYIAPISFGTSSTFTTDIIIPKGYVGAASGTKYLTTVTCYDIWGNVTVKSW